VTDTASPLLRFTNLSKTFRGQRALIEVDLELRSGEVCALVGQNGSGKSTLIKVLAGYHAPDIGARLEFDGQPVPFGELSAPWRRHIRFIHQDLGLVPTLNTLDNLGLGTGFVTGRWGRIRWRAEARRARKVLSEFGVDINVYKPVGRLSTVEQTLVAIVRALADWHDSAGILVLDEPTASLTQPEVQRLFSALRRVRQEGMAILFVSHRLEETFDIADRVVVLREGRLVSDCAIDQIDEHGLITQIIGRPPESLYPELPPARSDVVLEASGLTGDRARSVDIKLYAGEILGVAGLSGSGREEISDLIFDGGSLRSGQITVAGKRLTGIGPRRSVAAGIAFVPADRAARAVVPSFSVGANITLPLMAPLTRWGRIDRHKERADVAGWIERVELRPPNPDAPLVALSGGNQQKAIIAKWLRTKPRVLLADEPTQGVDVGAKAAIYNLLAEAAAVGTGVLLCSSEEEDLAELCDRVLVLRNGHVVAELAGAALTHERIVAETLRSDDTSVVIKPPLQTMSEGIATTP
jgi:ribose transport system ATP-binding protein